MKEQRIEMIQSTNQNWEKNRYGKPDLPGEGKEETA